MFERKYWEQISPDELFSLVKSTENKQFVINTLRTLSYDHNWTEKIIAQVEKGFIETRCFVSCMAKAIQPQSYLE